MHNHAPILSPIIGSALPSPNDQRPNDALMRRLSTSSVRSLVELLASTPMSSTTSLAETIEVVREEGLRHSHGKLKAKHYKTPEFASTVVEIIKKIRVPTWPQTDDITPSELKIFKVSGSLTNAVFFVSYPRKPEIRTVLLRVYGSSSGSLISRPRELHILHVLSSQYRIGPRIYGTFENGRLEEYFESTTLTAEDLRIPSISQWIGVRMAEMHSVDIEAVEDTSLESRGEGKGWEIGAKKNVRSWLEPAQEVLELPNVSDAVKKEIDLATFSKQWKVYMKWLKKAEDVKHGSRRVFAHNDAQYGNLLRIARKTGGEADHKQIIVVDFEYASPNPAAFDIANHFHEWTANYHGDTPQLLDPARYPTQEERFNFYSSYLAAADTTFTSLSDAKEKVELEKLDEQVRIWSPASHAMWAIWGLVQGREDIEGQVEQPEFDYIGYSRCRMGLFRRELAALNL